MKNEFKKGDSLDIMKSLPGAEFDLVITDPPYGTGGRDGGTHLENRNIAGNRMSLDSYIWFVRTYGRELYRITKSNSHCYVFSDWRRYRTVQTAMESVMWEMRSLIVWDKGNGMGEFWRSSHEFICFFTKMHPRKLTHGGCYNVLKFAPVKKKRHPAEKPAPLIEYLVKASTLEGEYVIDPFAGSGVVGEVARATHRRSLCIDIQDAPAGNQGAEPVQRLTAAGQNTGNALELDL